MQVFRTDIDPQNSLIKVEISKQDYAEKVEKSIDKYRKTSNIPGFRPGTVPKSLIQKKYGKGILAEELNRLANDGVYNFIKEQGIEILGNPLPKTDTEVVGNFDEPDQFEFTFEIGLMPTFDYQSVLKTKVDYKAVRVDDKLIQQQIDDICRRYGKLSSPEIAAENDMIMGTFTELNEDHSHKEGGIVNNTTISLEFLEHKTSVELFIGQSKDAVLNLDPKLVSKGQADLMTLLGIEETQLETLSPKFEFKITDIKRMEKAELNQDLFGRLFPDGAVQDEATLKAKVMVDLEQMFEKDADRLLTRKVYELLIADVVVNFPEVFLKKWIKMSAEKPISDEELESEFSSYLKSLKWQMIQTKIFKDQQIQLNQEEVMDHAKALIVGNYAQYGIPAPDEQELEESARKILSNKEQANGIYDQIAEQKLTNFFKSTMNLSRKMLSYDEFIAESKAV